MLSIAAVTSIALLLIAMVRSRSHLTSSVCARVLMLTVAQSLLGTVFILGTAGSAFGQTVGQWNYNPGWCGGATGYATASTADGVASIVMGEAASFCTAGQTTGWTVLACSVPPVTTPVTTNTASCAFTGGGAGSFMHPSITCGTGLALTASSPNSCVVAPVCTSGTAGTAEVGVGYSTSPVPGNFNFSGGYSPPASGCQNSCAVSYGAPGSATGPCNDPGGSGSAAGCLSQTADANGLYGVGAWVTTTQTGGSCGATDPVKPTASAACPGIVATFNGVTTCTPAGPGSPSTSTTASTQGATVTNGAGDTSQTTTSTTTGPGGSSTTTTTTTTSPGGPTNTSATTTSTGGPAGAGVGGGQAGAPQLTCGLPGNPKCQIDETGTPTTLGTQFSANGNQGLDDAATARINQAQDTSRNKSSTDFDFHSVMTLGLPASVSCVDPAWGLNGAHGLTANGTIPICARLATFNSIMAWFFWLGTLFAVFYIATGSVGSGGNGKK